VIDRDAVLLKVMQANPHPNDQDLPAGLADMRPPLALLIRSEAPPELHARLFPATSETGLRPNARVVDQTGPAGTDGLAVRRRWRAAALAFALVILVMGAAAFLAGLIANRGDDLIGADSIPTLTFDGETVAYVGPETFDTNVITFRVETTADRMIGFGWNVMNDESITLEEEIAWMETHRGSTYEIPPWVEDYGMIGTITTAWNWEETVELPDGKLLLYVWEPGPKILHPAAHISIDTG
jgi:hypothetical protein